MSQPDLNSIIELIMKNPQLIEQIQALAKKTEDEPNEITEINEAEEAVKTEDVRPVQAINVRSKRRGELLRAIAPYISENRRRAVESFMSIADILDAVR